MADQNPGPGLEKDQEKDQEPEQGQHQDNMYCPACEKFQPKAEACAYCEIIIEKALHPTNVPITVTSHTKEDGVSFRTLLLFLLFSVSVLYYFFGGSV